MSETNYREYRSAITNRPYAKNDNLSASFDATSTLDILDLTEEDLQNKKVLHIGIGRGRALREALEQHNNAYGVDIIPVLSADPSKPQYKLDQISIDNAKRELTKLAKNFPGRVVAADAADSLPFPDQEFDITIVSVSLPNYARNAKEAVASILEMIRVSKDKVVFAKGWEEAQDGIVELGIRNHAFKFNLKHFLADLHEFGITSTQHKGKRKGARNKSTHMELSKADRTALSKNREILLLKSDTYFVLSPVFSPQS